jgi:hypothetical protein
MTRKEWLMTLDPLVVFQNLQGKPSARKMRLFTCACCRKIWNLLIDERSRTAVEVAELYAVKKINSAEVMAYEEAAAAAVDNTKEYGQDPAAAAAVSLALWATADWGALQALRWTTELIARKEQVEIIDCIFRIPSRPITLNPSWLTSTALALATGIYSEKAFDRMPILADALQDAGCDNEDILNHLRGPGPHALGCWVLDLILGRE